MPRLFSYVDFAGGSDKVRNYADKHSPVIICNSEAERNTPFKVKVRIGTNAKHPNAPDHHYEYIQLWNLETLVGEVKLQRSSYGDNPVHIEADFTIIPKVSLRLTAVAYCNKHGLWRSEEVFVKVEGE
ncbi:MAG: hypothetical protein A2X19_08790 [Bacteroidetes bacterium GWE2_39_28]|jgi:superoxide reductase|nr:MAG: hypothetical protein A2X19_08790 [Bacteroidetes bacterium GWE2_39_28]OFY12192.1 MAG: hypothetical protein A2X16_06505 [Bacteroidetes bacterium GWF2_39_10]OFZ08961.1 MAG: hypothetical protein A2322_01755 [Bacteroidetes bacterium RIFOXYB2_FULL_39_7]OFZ12330.1 MAG: hypothetical protein A2465_10775 [Bacteroidetes bacterium RIFOXYC2_FULL_39_11]HCT94222.1 dethiobiotin synthase [Rikenellaceae bacterium]